MEAKYVVAEVRSGISFLFSCQGSGNRVSRARRPGLPKIAERPTRLCGTGVPPAVSPAKAGVQ